MITGKILMTVNTRITSCQVGKFFTGEINIERILEEGGRKRSYGEIGGIRDAV